MIGWFKRLSPLAPAGRSAVPGKARAAQDVSASPGAGAASRKQAGQAFSAEHNAMWNEIRRALEAR